MLSTLRIAFKYKSFKKKDQRYVQKQPYWCSAFKESVRLLQKKYRFKSPYRIAQDYGETPFFAWEKICIHFGLQPHERFIDLGCGRGALVFFSGLVIGCNATGYDCQQEFIAVANKISNKNPKLKFECIDLLVDPIAYADTYYLCGTCFSDDVLKRCIQYIAINYPSSRVLSTSFPLKSYKAGEGYKITNELEVTFPWGVTTVYENRFS